MSSSEHCTVIHRQLEAPTAAEKGCRHMVDPRFDDNDVSLQQKARSLALTL